MKKLSIALIVFFILLSGCTSEEKGESSNPSLTLSQPTFTQSTVMSTQPTTASEHKEDGLLASFSSNSQDKQLVLYRNSVSSLTVKTNGGTSNVPISKDWEKYVVKESIFASIVSNSNVSWLLLASEPSAGQMGKTLYKSKDNGKSWAFVNDISQVIDGYVTGVTFSDDKNGWVAATQHGTELVPLYYTKDGGKSWSVQNIDIPKGYQYGNAYPPIFNEKDTKQGTLKIEFVGISNTESVEFKTTDGGETWKS
ncbi:WD40/YVTN/BNR-like repeat-containing protein [Paenibacillus glycanilyticus]|uniref:WD40/YVTN/BNR-like repeat-containing protein n=1 Tax=Paenibacillus glycanilyticus TaxID=126569 RepID=UPI003EC0F61F